jgi:hypothetical protein
MKIIPGKNRYVDCKYDIRMIDLLFIQSLMRIPLGQGFINMCCGVMVWGCGLGVVEWWLEDV